MDGSGETVESLLPLAKAGHAGALGQILERYRNYLELLARIQIGRRLQSKVDPTDLVQETFLDAHATFAQFRGATEKELVAWLRQVLAYNLATLVRHYYGVKQRDVELERQLSAELDQSSHALDAAFIAPTSSPSQQAARREQAVILADALGRLPPEYRDVVILRQLQGLSFPEVAKQMNRSLDSVKKLFVRGLARLRGALGDKHEPA
jgi:RNA polymerase sigma-70 factor (ECF subfamily)